MKVIDILNEGAAAEVGERVLKSILGHATWSATQKIAFKDSVELCTDVIEQMLLKDQDITTPAATQAAWAAIKPRLDGTPWATREFVQEIFTVSAAEAKDRVAKKAGALKPKETPPAKAADDTTVEKLSGAQKATKYAKNILTIGVFGAAAYDVIFNSLKEYYDNQAEFLSRVRAKTMTAEQAKLADNQQKMVLVANIASVVVFPAIVSKIPSFTAGVAVWLLRVLKLKDAPPLKLRQMKDGTLLQVTKADTEPTAVSNSLLGIRNAVWLAWIGILNSNEPIEGTSNWNLYDQAGNVTGTVGAARIAAKLDPNLTPKEIVAWFAINKMWGVNVVQWVFDAFNTLWNTVLPDAVNYDTQKQSIDRAAGKPVTPNEFAKPPKVKQHDGVTLQGWD